MSTAKNLITRTSFTTPQVWDFKKQPDGAIYANGTWEALNSRDVDDYTYDQINSFLDDLGDERRVSEDTYDSLVERLFQDIITRSYDEGFGWFDKRPMGRYIYPLGVTLSGTQQEAIAAKLATNSELCLVRYEPYPGANWEFGLAETSTDYRVSKLDVAQAFIKIGYVPPLYCLDDVYNSIERYEPGFAAACKRTLAVVRARTEQIDKITDLIAEME